MPRNAPNPITDKEVYDCIVMNKANLRTFLGDFATSVSLFIFLQRGGGPPSVGEYGGIFHKYRIIAARDAALNIYHIKCAIDAIKKQLPRCQTLRGTTNAITIRSALKQLNVLFPHIDNIRHAIAHAGELFSDPREMRIHEQRNDIAGHGFYAGGGAGGFFTHALYQHTYTIGYKGTAFEVIVNETSIKKIAHVISLVESAFQKFDAKIVQLPEN